MRHSKSLNEAPHTLKLFTSGKGEPVALLHGQISTHRYMNDLANILEQTHTVYSPDLLGFGDSPRPKNATYSTQQHIASLHQTLQKTGIKTPFVLQGHSMGAQLALAYAAKYPDMVSGLIVSALPLFESPDSAYDQLGAMNPKIAWILRGKRARLLRLFTRYAEGPSMKIAGLVSKGDYPPHVVQDGVRHSWASFDRSMKNVVMQYDAFADIKKINCPIHFIFADKDTIAKNPQNKLRPYLGSKHSLTMVHGSHQIPLEHAKIIAERILSV